MNNDQRDAMLHEIRNAVSRIDERTTDMKRRYEDTLYDPEYGLSIQLQNHVATSRINMKWFGMVCSIIGAASGSIAAGAALFLIKKL